MEYESDSIFVAAFPEAVRNGSFVTIEGKQKADSSRFHFNLVCIPSGDKAFHCGFRLDERRVARNHSVHSPAYWGKEESDGGWPIQESGEFEISFKIKEDHIEIFVDGKLFANFLHRLAYSKITHINGTVGANYTSIKFGKNTNAP